jgi:hypothetical protein
MKLIALHITPAGNALDEVIEVAIDHNPARFKACYFCMSYSKDGSLHTKTVPANITESELHNVTHYATQIIESALHLFINN